MNEKQKTNAVPESLEPPAMPKPFDPNDYPREFETVYPGIYLDREKPLMEEYFAEAEAVETRGEVDLDKIIAGCDYGEVPGYALSFQASEAKMRYDALKYDPENPIYNDEEYAKKLGYKSLPALPTFAANDDAFMKGYPKEARDLMTVSSLNHSETFLKPIYAGDMLYMVLDSRKIMDLTPVEGSNVRHNCIENRGSVYNQRKEKVVDVIFRVTESNKYYKNRPEALDPAGAWDTAEWTSREQHNYTDKDYAYFCDIWSKEKRQGAEPLYWEDVNIGDEPAWTLDGPIFQSVGPVTPYGTGAEGSRTLKKEIMDPQIRATLTKDEYGIYHTPVFSDMVPDIPSGPHENFVDPMKPNFPPEMMQMLMRRGCTNYMGRDIALRHINNYMGDHGRLYNIKWGIMFPECFEEYGIDVPYSPFAKYFSEDIPELKEKHIVHAVVGDIQLVKSRVTNKYVQDGQFFITLTWWIETIEGYVTHEGSAEIILPSKNK